MAEICSDRRLIQPPPKNNPRPKSRQHQCVDVTLGKMPAAPTNLNYSGALLAHLALNRLCRIAVLPTGSTCATHVLRPNRSLIAWSFLRGPLFTGCAVERELQALLARLTVIGSRQRMRGICEVQAQQTDNLWGFPGIAHSREGTFTQRCSAANVAADVTNKAACVLITCANTATARGNRRVPAESAGTSSLPLTPL